MRNLLGPLTFSALLLIAIGGALGSIKTASAEPPIRLAVCHVGPNGGFQFMNIPASAASVHLGHGDGLIGDAVPDQDGYVFGEGCVPVLADPIAHGCYPFDGLGSSYDLYYVGPADELRNVQVLSQGDGPCEGELAYPTPETEDYGFGIISAADEAEAAEKCEVLTIAEGNVTFDLYTPQSTGYSTFPEGTWICSTPSVRNPEP